jgi:hypothetical protein
MENFFYDGQLRRYLLQITRLLSNFYVEAGVDSNGNTTLIRVPVRYGDASRQAQSIIQNNSANNIPSSPLITFYITGMEYARERIQEPFHISKMHVRQRKYNTEIDDYETEQGNAFTIERQMPVPYTMMVNADVWTSNQMQKHQLFEQISTLFNPSLEIQSTDNYIDWTSLSVLDLDRVNWTTRTIPVGTDDPIDIFTYSFRIPVWISLPARIKKLGVIQKVIASVYDSRGDAISAIQNNDLLSGTRLQITPWNYKILLMNNQIQAFSSSESETSLNNPLDWKGIIEMYGVLRDGISLIRLQRDEETVEIVGTIAYHPVDPKIMLITVDEDTVPGNTLQPIDAIVDPQRIGPGAGLPIASVGTRYLLVESIGSEINVSPSKAWGSLVAKENSIVEWNGSEWFVSFDPASENKEYVTNIKTGVQYVWQSGEWVKSFDGLYSGGEWSIVI